MRVVVAATAGVAIPTLEWLRTSSHDLVAVVTTPDSKVGRGKILTPSEVAVWATDKSLPLFKPDDEAQLMELIRNVDVVIAIAYGKILSEQILRIPKYGFLNLHFSLLPAYRGAAPVQRAIQNGEYVTGVSIFQIDKGLDTGPLYLTKEYEIPADANSEEVLRDLALLGAQCFESVLVNLESGVQPTLQKNTGVSSAPKITKEDALINWKSKGRAISDSVRAFTPSPGAWTQFKGNSVKINKVHISSENLDLKPGVILSKDKRVFVGTIDSSVEIIRLTPSGKSEMSASEWINGARLSQGDCFE